MAIELHGTISPQERNFDDKNLGTVCWGDNNNVYLIIGNQTLEGKISKPDRPLLVIQKTDSMGDNGEKNAMVKAIVRKKLIFKTRPRPLVISTVV
uniref:Transposase n=1 Tax=Caenorhabditis tropicalis TaxID=1561998 RepID=A0A1I7T440_9PELO